jgi:O-antigen/teichoic acid export membrane protein
VTFPARGRLVRLASSAGGAVTVQFLNAGGSFVLQATAARTLGASGYGAYALFTSVLVMITAVQTSWVGDSLTVFDRFERRLRGGIEISVLVTVGAGVAVSVLISASMGLAGPGGTGLFGLLIALWLMEETGRRVFTARMEFWRLVLNDTCYLVSTLAIVGAVVATGGEVSVEVLLAAMAVGAATAVIVAWMQLPGTEYQAVPLRNTAFREILSFASWRSVQAGVRPAALLGARMLIAAFASQAVLGGIEAARLLLAPALTFVNGSGWFLLGDYAKAQKSGRPLPAAAALRACAAMAGITLVLSLAGVVSADWVAPYVTGGAFTVDRVALAGWAVYAVSLSCTLPLSSLATARKRSRLVFGVRGVESVTGLVVLVVLLVADPAWAPYAPYCLGGGGLVSAALLWRLLRREDPGRTGSGIPVGMPATDGHAVGAPS